MNLRVIKMNFWNAEWLNGLDTYEIEIDPTDYKLVLTGLVQNHCG